jgi:CheY-like chemotaxis protein
MKDPARIRVLCVDDHPLLREGIGTVINNQPDMQLVGEASNAPEAMEQFRKHRPDVTLMDLRLPGMSGIDIMIAIRTEFPEARIIILTTFEGDVEIQRALAAGARAYMLKSMPKSIPERSVFRRRSHLIWLNITAMNLSPVAKLKFFVRLPVEIVTGTSPTNSSSLKRR